MTNNNNQTNNIELLNYVYQNAKLGSQSIGQLLPKVDNQKLHSILLTELSEYQKISQKASSLLSELNVTPKECQFDKLSNKTGIALSTLTNTSSSHIAELVMNGNTMGIIEITKKMNQNKDCSAIVNKLCSNLVETEEQSTQNMKQFL